MATRMLMTRVRSLTRASSSSSSSPPPPPHSLKLRFSSSCLPPKSPEVLSGAAAADVPEDDDEDLVVYSPTHPSSGVAQVVPTLLQPGVVIYDGVCHLCHGGVKWVIKADKYRKIKFCCLQSETAEPYLRLCGLDREDVLRRVLFVEGPGSYYQGSTAALKVLSHLPLPYSALSTLLIVPAPVREMVYDYVAKRRYDWFGKGEDCLVLKEKEMLERFIDRDELVGRSW